MKYNLSIIESESIFYLHKVCFSFSLIFFFIKNGCWLLNLGNNQILLIIQHLILKPDRNTKYFLFVNEIKKKSFSGVDLSKNHLNSIP
jgi:hypothetical protein